MIATRLLMGGGGSFPTPAGVLSIVAAPNGGAWTEVTGPHATFSGTRTYIGWVGGNNKINDIEIMAYLDAGTTEGPVLLRDNLTGGVTTSPDSHIGPAVLIGADGKIVTAYCGHGADNMLAKVSNNVAGATWVAGGFTAEIAVSTTAVAKTYPQLSQLSGAANRIYLRWRGTTAGQAGLYQKVSDDGGNTWATETELFHTTQATMYSCFASNGTNRIYQVVTDRAPDVVGGYGMWAFYTDETGTARKMDGTACAGSAPFPTSELTQIVAPGGDKYPYSCSLTDDGRLVIAWQTKNANPVVFGEFRQSAVGSATFLERTIGTSEPLSLSILSVGGGCHDWNDADRFFTGKITSGVIQMFLYTSGDDGATWSGSPLGTVTCAPSPVYVAPRGASLGVIWFGSGFTGSSDFAPSLEGYR